MEHRHAQSHVSVRTGRRDHTVQHQVTTSHPQSRGARVTHAPPHVSTPPSRRVVLWYASDSVIYNIYTISVVIVAVALDHVLYIYIMAVIFYHCLTTPPDYFVEYIIIFLSDSVKI